MHTWVISPIVWLSLWLLILNDVFFNDALCFFLQTYRVILFSFLLLVLPIISTLSCGILLDPSLLWRFFISQYNYIIRNFFKSFQEILFLFCDIAFWGFSFLGVEATCCLISSAFISFVEFSTVSIAHIIFSIEIIFGEMMKLKAFDRTDIVGLSSMIFIMIYYKLCFLFWFELLFQLCAYSICFYGLSNSNLFQLVHLPCHQTCSILLGKFGCSVVFSLGVLF